MTSTTSIHPTTYREIFSFLATILGESPTRVGDSLRKNRGGKARKKREREREENLLFIDAKAQCLCRKTICEE